MTLPSSSTWSLLDLNAANMVSVLTLSPSDATLTPGPAFGVASGVLSIKSETGTPAVLDFTTPMTARFTLDVTVRVPKQPHDVADVADSRIVFEIADDASRGIALYLSSAGLAVSRLDDFGSVAVLPGTSEDTQEISEEFTTIRIAVDGGLGRAYVLIGEGMTDRPALRFILPAEATPNTVLDRLRITALGQVGEPSNLEIARFRVAPDVLLSNVPPTADAGPDRVAPLGQAVRFDGRASYDAEGVPLTYLWRLVDAPYGSAYAADISAGFTSDDGDADGSTPVLEVGPGSLPVWLAVGDIVRLGTETFVIAAFDNGLGTITVSVDALPDNLPPTPFRIFDQSFLVGIDTDTPYGVPDVQGIYRVELIVNDGEVSSVPVEAIANVTSGRAPYGIEPDVVPIWRALGDDWELIPGREVFEEAWCGIAQILAGKMLEAWQYNYNLSIRDAQRVLQRKWIPYRTMVLETESDSVVLSPRYGAKVAAHAFEDAPPSTPGATLSVEYATATAVDSVQRVDIPLTSNTLVGLQAEIQAALSPSGLEVYIASLRDPAFRTFLEVDITGDTVASSDPLPTWAGEGDTLAVGGVWYKVIAANLGTDELTLEEPVPQNLTGVDVVLYRGVRLGIRGATGFRVLSSSGATALGLKTGWNYLEGDGALATDRSYIVFGVDLLAHGVQPGDLLVINNGQSIEIDRVLSDPDDPHAGCRVLLREELPTDASTTWAIPSLITSQAVDYELRNVYPGDLAKFEILDDTLTTFSDQRGIVVAQKGAKVAANLEGLQSALIDPTRYNIRFLGVKRRKAVDLPDDVVSVPRLQDVIPVSQPQEFWYENTDYILEPFYRDNGYARQVLQFRDSVFIDPDLEPPDILWAELTLFNNDIQIENLFGRLVGFSRDDASKFDRDFNYLSGTAGLLYSLQQGPHVYALRVGAQILLGQPFAEVAGTIMEIDPLFTPNRGRVLIRDNEDTRSEVVRTYYYRKDPLDLSATSGLDFNPETGVPWAEGDTIAQFAPIGSGVRVIDMYNDPEWYYPYVRSGLMSELEKFNTFVVEYNVDIVSLANLALLSSFMLKAALEYAAQILVGQKGLEEDIDVIDNMDGTIVLDPLDSTHDSGKAFTYDDTRGDGTLWSYFDDGETFFDGIVDCPTDLITLILTGEWLGGTPTYDAFFFYDTDVVDVDGAHTGTPGTSFSPTYDMTLEAGTYEVTAVIKSGGVVLP